MTPAAAAPPTPTLERYLRGRPAALSCGPLAILLIEDGAAIRETLDHHLQAGFRHILALSPEPVLLPDEMDDRVTNLLWNTRRPAAHVDAVNAVIAAVPEGTWLFYAFNAEFLFYPFAESRSIGEMLAFHTEERREAMLSYVIDLYAPDLDRAPDAVDLNEAMFDRSGYFALGRPGPDGQLLPRQLDFHGGLRWRFEEYLPADRRRIDRIGLFRARKGLRITADHRFNIEEYNTYACAWHHNLTAAILSFRVAKALVGNPGSRERIGGFTWRNSQRFDWSSQQLMDMGLIEPGQWF
ncbi:glycosyltransferase family 2 protein [Paracoccus spongiarum]|uniref:Glycosyltransferase family 2 protein n=1 Tax=Paracoccus spongiarum TaxID=3064387 RepID=A0ABT9J7P6_9RHOB|nr:glycosyltransferase family 2 protein [Paracoccus sp. 2205BS29-5]MDP5305826.1 glycosyltransferase family 2 protein [Paracoccus sp. 2205BS29-5]